MSTDQFETSRRAVQQLCVYYEKNQTAFKAATLREAQVRLSLIDPLFEALGWDVNNKGLVAPQYREVVPEKNLQVEGTQRAPDYAFRVGTLNRFFVEAKRCTADLKSDASHAYQIRRYGWSGKTPLAILTNFAEFAVYDCSKKPSPNEKAAASRILYFTFDQYVERWEEIWNLFSRQAVWSGSFDSFSDSKRKRGTAEVDAEFLRDLDEWREVLAKNIAQRNKFIAVDDLNKVVQLTIDRIVFLRMAEDRGLEPPEQLLDLSKQPDVYRRFVRNLCRRADEKYNSGLFHFSKEPGVHESPDTLTPSLIVDDKPFRSILQGLYFEHGSPYDFGVLPVEILGTVYERFLGKVIRLTAGHSAKIEEKPLVRKAGGVYYTPSYVVDYIVSQTVGKAIAGLSPRQLRGTGKGARPFRILDMACGSGSFLLGAYKCLLDHHLTWYLGNSPSRHKAAVTQAGKSGEWQLTIEEKKKILTTHLFGVDIDTQAVEVTKLSLLLRALEGENDLTISQQMQLFGERALPNLADNIKCGNSLISHEYFDQRDASTEEIKEVNAFDWQLGFPDVGPDGWDCIIGNPPYVQIENIPVEQRSYYKERYGKDGSLGKRYDLYQMFFLRGMELLASGGRLGFITPNTFLTGHSYPMLRTRMTETCRVEQVVDLPQGVFEGVTVDVVLTFLKRDDVAVSRRRNSIEVFKLNAKSQKIRLTRNDWDDTFKLRQSEVEELDARVININANPEAMRLLTLIEEGSVPLGDVTESSQGIILYKDEAAAKASRYTGETPRAGWKELLRGTNIGRYEMKWAGEYVHYGPWLWCHREEKYFNQRKILLQAMRNKSLRRRLVATLDTESHYNAHNLANIIRKDGAPYSLEYLLALINSSLINFWYKCHFSNVNINPSDFRRIPVKALDLQNPTDRKKYERLEKLASKLLELHEKQSEAASEQQRQVLQSQIDAADATIDTEVFDLYGIAADDRAVVLEAS